MQKKQLMQTLHDVFPLVPIPRRIFNEESSLCDFDDELNAQVLGKDWSSIELGFWTFQGIMRSYNRYSLSPEALHYYTPSVIRDVLSDPDNVEDFSCLVLPAKGYQSYWVQFHQLFNQQQVKLILDCIFYLDEYSATRNGEWYTSTQEYHDLNRAFDLWSNGT